MTSDGYVVTNHHVIDGCNNVEIINRGKAISATVVSFDSNNDLALLKSNFKPLHTFPLRRDNPYNLMDVYVAGYPFGYDISTPIKITEGIVSSLAGLGNNFSQIQIDAAVQPGNSGGPIIDSKGNVVGVVVSKLDLEKMMENLLFSYSKNLALLKEAVMDYIVKHKTTIIGKVSFSNVPGDLVTDVLAAMARGEEQTGEEEDESAKYVKMRVGTLRKMLDEKGLDVDGSRESMIALLKESDA